MKKISVLTLLLSAAVLLLVSCGKNIEYTTLGAVASLSSDKQTEMDIHVRDVVVTAVSDAYVLIEDKTGAAQISLSAPNTELIAGNIISAHLKGVCCVKNGGLEISHLEVSSLSSTPAAPEAVPFVEASIAELNTNPSSYTHKRVLVKDITFAEHFNGAVGDRARIVQSGKVGTVVARTAEYYAIAGDQGDLYVYPADGVFYVYTDKEYIEHEVISPFTKKTTYGAYSIGASDVKEVFLYKSGEDQTASGKNGDVRFARIQNYFTMKVLCVNLPSSKLSQGNFVNASVKVQGYSGISEADNQEMYIEKLTADKMWLVDLNSSAGYILPFEK